MAVKKKAKKARKESILLHGPTGATLGAFGYRLAFKKRKKLKAKKTGKKKSKSSVFFFEPSKLEED